MKDVIIAIAIIIGCFIISFTFSSVMGNVVGVYEQRKTIETKVQMIKLSGDYCTHQTASFNAYTGEFNCN